MTRFVSGRWLWLNLLCVIVGCGKNADDGATAGSPSTGPSPSVSSTTSAVPTAPAAPPENGDPVVVMHTSLGSLYVRLYERQAPRTVANFLDYARNGHYGDTVFHQVEPGYVALGGAFNKQLQAKPVRYPVANEADNGLKNVRGSLAMARDPGEPNSATAMFFINLADNPKLDHQGPSPEQCGFCVFGQVIDGFDVLDKLSAVQTGKVEGFTSMPVERVVLNTVKLMPSVPKEARAPLDGSRYVGFGR